MTLCVNENLRTIFIQLCGNLSTTVNTGAEKYCHRGWMLTIQRGMTFLVLLMDFVY